MYKKDLKEPIFWSGQLEPTWRGAVAGGALIFTTLAVASLNPAMRVRFCLLVFGALGRKTQRAQTGGLCAVALAKVASLGLTALRYFFCDFPRCAFCG